MNVCLDLFSGLGGFSSAFEEDDDWHVITVDIDDRFDPTICADVVELTYTDIEPFLPDVVDTFVILASPPCTEFSIAASRYEKVVDGRPQTEDAKEDTILVYHTIGLIKALDPDYWFMENPRGYLRQIIGDPKGTVTYCQYGTEYMKPTDLWGDHPQFFEYKSCNIGDSCHAYNTDIEHGGKGNCEVMDKSKTLFQQKTSGGKAAQRAKVPYELSLSIKESVEGIGEPQSASDASW